MLVIAFQSITAGYSLPKIVIMILKALIVLVSIKGLGGIPIAIASTSMEFIYQLDRSLMLKVSTGGHGKVSIIPSSLLR